MKKIFLIILITLVASISITFLFGCATWNQTKAEQEYGPPTKKEIVDDKTIYQYYYLGRRQGCLDFTFDKGGKLINKREYYDEQCKSQQIDYWLAKAGGEPPTIDVTGNGTMHKGVVFSVGAKATYTRNKTG